MPEAQAAPFTVIVSISPSDGVEMSSNAVLYFAANAMTSTGEVAIAAVDNDLEAANPEVKVSGIVTGASDVLAPLDVTLTIQDDEAPQASAAAETLARAWLARFGRTVAGHVTDAIAERLNGSSDSRVTLSGRPLPLGGTRKGAANGNPAAAQLDALGHNGWERWQRPSGAGGARALTDRELLLGSSFLLNLSDGEAAAKGTGPRSTAWRWTAWGRAAASRFDGEADGYSLDGDVTTVTLGADAARGRWLGGLALAHSVGAGGYRAGIATAADRGNSSGKPESSVTSVHPYLRFKASEHLSFWGVLGYGKGELTLETERAGNRRHWNTGIEMWMAAAGARGVLVAAKDTGGFELAARTDAQFMRMSSASATEAAESGGLAAARAETSRLRLAMEGSYRFAFEGGQMLVPSLEVGLRHDGGDAETGAGIEVGGSVRYADPKLGFTVEAKMRGLIAHEDADYAEWGAGASLRFDPGAGGRGLSLSLSPAWGAATGRAGRLRSLHDVRGLAANDPFRPAARLEAEAAYGLAAFGGRGAMTPSSDWRWRRRGTAPGEPEFAGRSGRSLPSASRGPGARPPTKTRRTTALRSARRCAGRRRSGRRRRGLSSAQRRPGDRTRRGTLAAPRPAGSFKCPAGRVTPGHVRKHDRNRPRGPGEPPEADPAPNRDRYCQSAIPAPPPASLHPPVVGRARCERDNGQARL